MKMRGYKDIVSGVETVLPAVPTQCKGEACAVRLPAPEPPREQAQAKGDKQ
jgi:hypothetical protein